MIVSSLDDSSLDGREDHDMAKKQVRSPGSAKRIKIPDDASEAPGPDTITTAIHISKSTWNLLRAVAFHRAQVRGGRASVSKLLAELVERHRAELEKEL